MANRSIDQPILILGEEPQRIHAHDAQEINITTARVFSVERALAVSAGVAEHSNNPL